VVIARLVAATSATGITMAASALALAQDSGAPAAVTTGYAPVNGLRLYYEIRGTGEPLILLHGGLGSIETFGPIMPSLTKIRRVIAIDLQGHGRTADIDRPLSYEAMADDIAALMRYLKIEQADVMGYSLGAGVALRTAIQHPTIVRRLVVVSTPFKRDGWYPEIRTAMSQISAASAPQLVNTPLYETYARLSPHPNFPVLLTKLGAMLSEDYDWSTEVAAIKAPTLLVFGDADAVRTAHAVEFYELLGGGKRDAGRDGSGMSTNRLAILPGVTHYNIADSPALASTVSLFLMSHRTLTGVNTDP
jgi:pimeloyl-ACP methyl ester carboxylesterase